MKLPVCGRACFSWALAQNATTLLTKKQQDANGNELLEIERRTFANNNPGEMNGMVVEEELLQNARGRRTNEDRRLREEGSKLRDTIRDSLWNAGLRRPK